MTSYPEPMVARVTGINKRRVVDTRKRILAKGEDWTVEAAVVCYTPAGLEKLVGALGLAGVPLDWPAAGAGDEAGGDLEAAGEATAAEEPAVQTVVAVEKIAESSPACPPASVGLPGVPLDDTTATIAEGVEALQTPRLVELTVLRTPFNPTLVVAKDAEGVEVKVRVASNVNFLPGMKLKASPPPAGGRVFAMVGHCPRWRGRW